MARSWSGPDRVSLRRRRRGRLVGREGIGHAFGMTLERPAPLWSNMVPARRRRSRCALVGDMPTLRAACATQPLSSRAIRKRRCLAGVQWARSAGADGDGFAGRGAGFWSIRQDRSEDARIGKRV